MITVTPITMSGVFAPLAEEFVAFKRAQGYKYYSEAKILSRFCRFTERYGLAAPVVCVSQKQLDFAIRYTFAVHALQKWVEHGEDLTAMLPVLSVFMGHKSMQGTSRHLRLTAEVYPDAIRQVVSPHVLRHSKAMHLLQSGVNLVYINLLLSIRRPAFLIGNSNDFAFIHEVLPPFFGYSHSRPRFPRPRAKETVPLVNANLKL